MNGMKKVAAKLSFAIDDSILSDGKNLPLGVGM
jgi:hypothetical protein